LNSLCPLIALPAKRSRIAIPALPVPQALFLRGEQWKALDAIAKDIGAPIAWQIRAAIELYLEGKKKGKKSLAK
jgi:hypothetical protein